MVITQGLKEKVTCLSGRHGHHPSQQGGNRGINEQQTVGHHKSHGTQQVQGLVDPTVVVIPMIIPTLNTQFFKKFFHAITLRTMGITIMLNPCEKTVTSVTYSNGHQIFTNLTLSSSC
jgi:hypothetical protein